MEIRYEILATVQKDIQELQNKHNDAYEVLKRNPIYRQYNLALMAKQTLKKHFTKHEELRIKFNYTKEYILEEGKKELQKHRTKFMKYMPYGSEQRNILDIGFIELQKDLDYCQELLDKEDDYINYNKLEKECRDLREFESLIF